MSQSRAPRVPSSEARARIVAAAEQLLRAHEPLTVDAVMARAGLARTVFYRHFDGLPALALATLPDAGDPIVDQARRALHDSGPDAAVTVMVDQLVAVFAAHGPLLRAIDDVVRRDPALAADDDPSLAEPVAFIASLLRQAPHPPPHPQESARLIQAAFRGYLLDAFGGPQQRVTTRTARRTLRAFWTRLLA